VIRRYVGRLLDRGRTCDGSHGVMSDQKYGA
jgi:hypothetical protein